MGDAHIRVKKGPGGFKHGIPPTGVLLSNIGRGGTASRLGHSEPIFVEGTHHTCRRTQPPGPFFARCVRLRATIVSAASSGAPQGEPIGLLLGGSQNRSSNRGRAFVFYRGGDNLCTSMSAHRGK